MAEVKERNPAAAQKLNRYERQIAALNYRKRGLSYRQIAANMAKNPQVDNPKYSEAQAYRDVMHALEYLNKQRTEEAALYRRLELERLDMLWVEYFERASKGDVFSVNVCMTIMDKRIRLLGLAAPARQEISAPGGGPVQVQHSSMAGLSDEELRQRVEELAAFAAGTGRGAGGAGRVQTPVGGGTTADHPAGGEG